MKHALLLLLLAMPASASAAPPTWAGLTPGSYAVGYRTIDGLDHARPWRADGTPRPIKISVWYPARPGTGKPLRWGEYLAEDIFRFPLMRDLTDEQRGRLRALETAALRDAAPAAGRFPLVIYSLGPAAFAGALPEYLASHGYVVASAPRQGAFLGVPADVGDRTDLENKLADCDFIIDRLSTDPQVDAGRLAALGFSAGGRWALTLAMKNRNVRAVVALDTVMLWHDAQTKAWRQMVVFDLDAVRVPVLDLVKTDFAEKESMELWKGLRYADRTRAVFSGKGLDHLDFQAIGYAMTLVGARPQLAPAIKDAFETWSRSTLAFLDRHVRGAAGRAEVCARGPAGCGDVTHLAAEPAPKGRMEIFGLLADKGAAAGAEAIREARRSGAGVDEPTVNLAGYVALGENRPADAVLLFSLNTDAFPASANAWDSLADGYVAAGDKAKARAAVDKARALLDADPSMPAERRAAIRKSIDDKLKDL